MHRVEHEILVRGLKQIRFSEPPRWIGFIRDPHVDAEHKVVIIQRGELLAGMFSVCPTEGIDISENPLTEDGSIICPIHGSRLRFFGPEARSFRVRDDSGRFYMLLPDDYKVVHGCDHVAESLKNLEVADNEQLRKELEAALQANRLQERQILETTRRMNAMLKEVEDQRNELKDISRSQESLNSYVARVTDTMDSILVVAGPDGGILQVNRAFRHDMGYRDEEMLGRNLDDILTREERDSLAASLPQLPWKIRSVLYERIFVEDHYTGEHRLQPGHGNSLAQVYLVNGTILHSAKGKEDGVVIVASNISRLKEVEEQLRSARMVAESASQAKSHFLANMSHEIRTPMNAIIGLTELLLGMDFEGIARDYLSKVHSSGKSLLGIINDILDFSKIEAGKLSMESIYFELSDVLDNLKSVVGPRIEHKELELLFNLSEDVPRCLLGDPLRLGQVLVNLTSNAVKFTDKGEVIVSISVKEQVGKEIWLDLKVQDSGIGMTREQMERLFQSFSQADTSTTRKYGGTGLGLAISKNLVEMMGGRIGVDSEPGRGSTFSFTARFGTVGDCKKSLLLGSASIADRRVMVVDDSNAARIILGSILENFSLKTTLVSSGEEALDELGRGEIYDILVLDWKLPGISGLEVARKIRSLSLPRIPAIIMATAYGRSDLRRDAEEAGVDAFLEKPIEPSQLYNAILDVVGGTTGELSVELDPEDLTAELIQGLPGARVLLVEDHPINQLVARGHLERIGVSVYIAGNGLEGFRMAREGGFDLVLMDIQMPVMDGYEATRKIREVFSQEELPVIAMTAHAMSGVKERCLLAGMNDYVGKPIDSEELIRVLRKWINKDLNEELVEDTGHLEVGFSVPGVDVSKGVGQFGGDRELYVRYLETFVEDLEQEVLAIRAAMEQRNCDAAAAVAHKLKGAAGNLAAEDMFSTCRDLESALHQRDEALVLKHLAVLARDSEVLGEGVDKLKQLWGGPAGSAAAGSPMDSARVAELLKEIRGRISRFELLESELLEELQEALGRSGDPKALKRLEHNLESFEYEKALDLLEVLEKELMEPRGEDLDV